MMVNVNISVTRDSRTKRAFPGPGPVSDSDYEHCLLDAPVRFTFLIVDDEPVLEATKVSDNYVDGQNDTLYYECGDDIDLTDEEEKEAWEAFNLEAYAQSQPDI